MRYRELFTIEVLHDYFADGKARPMLFTPTAACRAVLAEAGLQTRSYGNKLYVIAPTTDGLKPFRKVAQPGTLSFYVQPADADFFQYTNLPLDSSSSTRYYFSNRDDAVVDGKTYLHARQRAFDSTATYTVGGFVRSTGGNCYECLVNLPRPAPQPPNTLTNAAYWRNLGKVSYADTSHAQSFTGPVVHLPVAPAANQVTVEIFGINDATLQLDVTKESNVWTYTEPVSSQQVPLTGLSEGLYRLRVNGVDYQRYYSRDGLWVDNVALIQIFTNNTVPADYQLLSNSGQFLSPTFSIRVAALSPLWQYVARTNAVKKIYDDTSGSQIEFESVAPLTFQSKLPVRLQEKPYDKIAMEYNNADPPDPAQKMDIKKLNVPGYRNKRIVRKNDTDYLIAEIHLNY